MVTVTYPYLLHTPILKVVRRSGDQLVFMFTVYWLLVTLHHESLYIYILFTDYHCNTYIVYSVVTVHSI
ncbi:hypothetical protein VN97_g1313 [Penicillium thymicola]|uniref:Uncharacterized protein n=1 Tax=Penicillium thymicola TaxID=293382 RepID=A0AAI9TSI4_PENTH|nr:hypothetical protein VN97_g1313 [Penicillium thymicola]